MPTPHTGSSTSLVPFTGDPLIDGLIIGEKWGGALGTGFSVTHSFPDLNSTWSTDPDIGYDDPGSNWEPWDAAYRGLDSTQQHAARIALQAWGSVANVNPVETADNASVVGDIRIAFTTGGTMDAHTYAYAYTPQTDTPYAGDVWLNPVPPVAAGNDFSIGAAGYATVIHELGHALGLDHPFSIRNFPPKFDTYQYSVMSYSDAPDHVDTATSAFYPTTPMLLDIQALQYLYGPNMTYHAGNDIYTFDQGVNYYQTIWDAGGIDTIRYNATTDGALIDLRAGQFSRLGKAILLSDGVTHQHDNVAIAFNVTVENAIGGDADDEIIGNSGDNVLDGGAGIDTLSGRTGNDTYVVGNAADVVTELASQGTDLVQSAITYALGPNVENLTLTGSSGINGTGNSAGNAITGNSKANLLIGEGGNDTLTGNVGNDTLDGRGGIDALRGGAGKDTLNGGTGNDALSGGSRNDTLIYHAADTSVQGGGGADRLKIEGSGVTLDLTLIANTVHRNIEVISLAGTGNNTLRVALSDVLAISSTRDTLRVTGNAGDIVKAGTGWAHGADRDFGSNTYDTYTKSTATLLVDSDITQNIFP